MKRTAILSSVANLLIIKPRVRTCKICATLFEMRSMSHVVCSPVCAQESSRLRREKDALAKAKLERKTDKVRREAIKTRSDHMKAAQVAFNAWVKERDDALPCVSCGRHHSGAYHAGHYLSVGARPGLRFEPLNVWKQCAPCNLYLSGNLVLYRQELIRRIGIEKVEQLEGPHEPQKLSMDDLKAMAKEYRAKRLQLKGVKNG